MAFTDFFPIFLCFVIYACMRPANWAIATGVLAFFQSASPFLIGAGGRAIGLAPAYCLIPIGLCFAISRWLRDRNTRGKDAPIPGPIWLIYYFTLIAIGCSLLLPRIFEGQIDVLPPRFGLDSGLTERLKPSSGNYIQSVYLFLNMLLVVIPASLARNNLVSRANIIQGVTIGALLSATLGFYQVIGFSVGLPWPNSIINSNVGVLQNNEQVSLGIQRMSATFLEASQMAQHFLGAAGLLFFGGTLVPAGCILLAALMLSTSSTAYFGLIALTIAWALLDMKTRLKQTVKIFSIFLLICIIGYALDLYFFDGRLVDGAILNKLTSKSGNVRLRADGYALDALIESYGLGVGVGSLRSSGFWAGFAAAVGIQGSALFSIFLGSLFIHLKTEDSIESKAILFGLIGCAIGWAISVPDTSIPLFWLLAGGALIGYKKATA